MRLTAFHFENLPEEMKARDAWVNWKEIPRLGKKADKVLFIAGTAIHASSTNHCIWRSFDVAEAALKTGKFSGIGFCVEGSKLVALDLDDVRDPDSGYLTLWGKQIVEKFASYTEVSPSNRGLRIIVRGKLPADTKHLFWFCDGSKLEMWDSGRYVTMTGQLTQQWPKFNEIRSYDFTNFWPELEDTMKAYAPFQDSTRLDAEQWLERYGIPTLSKKLEGSKATFEIECPGTHGDYPKDDGKCFVIQFPDGALSCGCQHSSCSFSKESGNHWRELRVMFEPETANHKNTEASGKTEASNKTETTGTSKIVIHELPDVCTLAEEKVEFIVPGLLLIYV